MEQKKIIPDAIGILRHISYITVERKGRMLTARIRAKTPPQELPWCHCPARYYNSRQQGWRLYRTGPSSEIENLSNVSLYFKPSRKRWVLIVHNGVLDSGVEMIDKLFTLDALALKLEFILESLSG